MGASRGIVDIEWQNREGLTPLLAFVHRFERSIFYHKLKPDEAVACLKCLKALGADFAVKTRLGETALHIWASSIRMNDFMVQTYRSIIVRILRGLIDCGVPVHAVDGDGKTAVEQSCTVDFDDPIGLYKDRLLRPIIWIETLENTGNDPAQFQVLVDAFPDLQRNVYTQATHTEGDELEASGSASRYDPTTPDSGNEVLSDEYDSDSTDTEDIASHQSSEASLDHDPSSPAAQARTSEPPSPSPSARVRAPAGTFWDVIDYAVEQQEGNPWES